MALFSDAVMNFYINSQQAQKDLKKIGDGFTQTFEGVKKTVASAFGVVSQLSKGLGLSILKEGYGNMKQIAEMSEKWKIDPAKISTFANQLSAFGGKSSDAVGDLEKLQNAINNLDKAEGGPLKELAARLKINIKNMDGSMKDAPTMMEDLRRAMKALNKDAQVKVAQDLGFNQATLNYLRASDDQMKEVNEKTKNHGKLTKEGADSLLKFEKSVTNLKQAFTSMMAEILAAFQPVIEGLTEVMNWFAGMSKGTKQIIIGVVSLLGFLGTGMKILSLLQGPLNIILSIGGALVGVIKAIGVAAMANPIILIIGAVIAAVWLIIANWTKVKNFFKKMVEFLKGLWDKIVAMVKNSIIYKFWAAVGRGIGRLFGFGGDDKKDDAKTKEEEEKIKALDKKPKEIHTTQAYTGGGVSSTVNNNTHTTGVNATVTINASDGKQAGQEFLDTVNRQNTRATAY